MIVLYWCVCGAVRQRRRRHAKRFYQSSPISKCFFFVLRSLLYASASTAFATARAYPQSANSYLLFLLYSLNSHAAPQKQIFILFVVPTTTTIYLRLSNSAYTLTCIIYVYDDENVEFIVHGVRCEQTAHGKTNNQQYAREYFEYFLKYLQIFQILFGKKCSYLNITLLDLLIVKKK